MRVFSCTAGLDGGANDYLPKPFKFDELMARIRLRLRESGQQSIAETVLRHGDISLDLTTRRVTVGDRIETVRGMGYRLI